MADEEQRHLHEEILALRQYLSKEANGIVPATRKKPPTSIGSEAVDEQPPAHPDGGAESALADGDEPRILTLPQASSPAGDGSSGHTRLTDDETGFVVTAQANDAGTSLRPVAPTATDEMETAKQASSASPTPSPVDVQLKVAESMVAKMRAELGLDPGGKW